MAIFAAISRALNPVKPNGKISREIDGQILAYFFLNPVAWFLLLLLIVAVYANYKLNGQLDTVCDAIKLPDEFIDKPKNAYQKAQNVCEDRMPED